ncbi:MAG: hypothetical protein ACRBFS_00655 [Aureispira sp.]
MSTRNILDEIESKGKVYNQKMLCIGAFFGGPLTAGYLMIENYKALNQREKVPPAWFIAIVGMLVYVVGAVSISFYIIDIPDLLYGLLSMFAANAIYKKEQEDAIAEHLKDGGSLHSGWRVTGVLAVVFMLILAIVFVGAYFFFSVNDRDIEPIEDEVLEVVDLEEDPIASRVYGRLDHVISYNRSQLNIENIDDLGEELINLGYFDETSQRIMYIEEERARYTFFIIETEERAKDRQVLRVYSRLQEELALFLQTTEIEFILTDEDWEAEYARF